jgi:endonuclease/exonuclease/phosphatase family metal-dependent hydrolase
MSEFTIMSYNIEHMNLMFENNIIKPSQQQRAQKIAKVIQEINPHVLGICEAANSSEEHKHFIDNYLPASGYQLAHGVSRGGQNLVFYYREPFSVVSIDDELSFYEPWEIDIDNDGLKEQYSWDRKPLEVLFKVGSGGPQVRMILVHTKSKGIFSVVDLYNFQKISLANRKRLVSQALRLRERLDQLRQDPNASSIIVMGDMNDGPGMDHFEMMIGKSFVETVMGSIYEPSGIFHNALWWMSKDSKLRKDLWTVDFPDPIVKHHLGYQHHVWIDHILLSPDMLHPNNPIRYIPNSGKIGVKNKDSREASDHFCVYCKIEVD